MTPYCLAAYTMQGGHYQIVLYAFSSFFWFCVSVVFYSIFLVLFFVSRSFWMLISVITRKKLPVEKLCWLGLLRRYEHCTIYGFKISNFLNQRSLQHILSNVLVYKVNCSLINHFVENIFSNYPLASFWCWCHVNFILFQEMYVTEELVVWYSFCSINCLYFICDY